MLHDFVDPCCGNKYQADIHLAFSLTKTFGKNFSIIAYNFSSYRIKTTMSENESNTNVVDESGVTDVSEVLEVVQVPDDDGKTATEMGPPPTYSCLETGCQKRYTRCQDLLGHYNSKHHDMPVLIEVYLVKQEAEAWPKLET